MFSGCIRSVRHAVTHVRFKLTCKHLNKMTWAAFFLCATLSCRSSSVTEGRHLLYVALCSQKRSLLKCSKVKVSLTGGWVCSPEAWTDKRIFRSMAQLHSSVPDNVVYWVSSSISCKWALEYLFCIKCQPNYYQTYKDQDRIEVWSLDTQATAKPWNIHCLYSIRSWNYRVMELYSNYEYLTLHLQPGSTASC